MNTQKKIVSLDILKKKIVIFRKKGKRIIFTNGCFDLLHIGHVNYLEKIKGQNDILIVAVNSDASVKKIKVTGRPVQSQRSRAGVIAGLEAVDFVIIFSEETPYNVIKALKPDVLLKGADWKSKGVVGQDIVESSGGSVKFVKYLKGFSTTSIIETVLKKCV
ncbi:MAG: D-glycero-beta-D-manno-heptose 1-phosphate adenylyltransferase [Candidatus Omnitrophica bacterium]|nr:D-glycero-beta-D-manno-heptose 1-phosphate adenylyltransferase [Candidatus Omnitrophota bacterium]